MQRSLWLVVGLLALTLELYGQIPRTLSYQGVLTDTTGKAKSDGTYTFTFRLYDVASGGTAIWTEPSKSLQVKAGLFSTLLGSAVPFSVAVDFKKPYWLGVEVGSEGELSPRVPFSSVAYGFRAMKTDTADVAVSVVDTSITTSKLKNSAVTSGKIGPGQVGKSINTLSDSVTLLAGTNVTITPSGNTLTIAATGGGSGNVSGTGSAGQVAFWTGTSAVSGDNGVYWDNANKRLGVGTSAPLSAMEVQASGSAIQAVSQNGVAIYGGAGGSSGTAVEGHAAASSGTNYGVRGSTLSTSGYGVYGSANAATGTNYGVYGTSSSSAGYGICGSAVAPTGTNYGVRGASSSPSGYGIYGTAPTTGVFGSAEASSGATIGVYGDATSTSGCGVRGDAVANSGQTYGVFGQNTSPSGYGVCGAALATSGANSGVYGSAASTSGYGVRGDALATSGTNYGVYGSAAGSTGYGVYGFSPTRGVWGSSTTTSGWAAGVYGACSSTSGYGVYGYSGAISGTNYGVVGYDLSPDGYGVYGYAGATSGSNRGVMGISYSTLGLGVYGLNNASSGSNYGVLGQSVSSAGYGVVGWASSASGGTTGVWGESDSPTGRGVYGNAPNGGTAVVCDGNFYQSSGVFEAHPTSVVWSTNKPATVKLNSGTKVKLFTEEAAELYFTDYGEGRLSGGRAHVELDGMFLQTVTVDARHPVKVFVQLEGDCRGVFVTNKTATGFDVVELQGGASSAGFSYRVVCKRKYYEDERLATQEQDIQYNTRMLLSAWPEVIAEQNGQQATKRPANPPAPPPPSPAERVR
jgi:hypothetical protein